MNKIFKIIKVRKISVLISTLILLSSMSLVYGQTPAEIDFSVDDVIFNTSQHMLENTKSFSDAWTVIGLARSNVDVEDEYYEKYYENLKKRLEDNDGVLNERKYTEYSSAVIALTSIGLNPTKIGEYNLLEKLADYDSIVGQGINGAIWALIALDSGNYDVPQVDSKENITTHEKLVDFILSREISGGGWSMGESIPDSDVTAMVLQSLSKYQYIEDVKLSIERGIDFLSKTQQNDGGYESWGTKNSESDSQVILALCELGIDPKNNKRFIKDNGCNVISNIINNFYVSDKGGFMHTTKTDIDELSTKQGFSAIVEYDRFIKGKTSFYDMSDVEKKYVDDEIEDSDTKLVQVEYNNKFTDIENDIEKQAIISLSAQKIINGITEEEFRPNDKITRAQFATLISHALGLDEINTKSFTDIKDEDWFSGFVGAVEELKIVTGYTDGTFKPERYITRQEAAVMLERTAKILGIDTTMDSQEVINTLCQFTDYIQCDDWSMDSMAFCVKHSYIPDEEMQVYPKKDATRSEIAGMVYRMLITKP